MKILFISYSGFVSFGMMQLSSVLKKAGFSASLIIPRNNQELIKEINQTQPDLIAFSCTTGIHNWALDKARIIKEKFNTPIIMGGPHPTFCPDVINEQGIDMICIGEGEEALLELMNKMKKHKDITSIKNIWVKKDNKIFKNPLRPLIQDLDGLPLPDRELYYGKYKYLRKSTVKNFIAGRGCPFNCIFCANQAYKKLYTGLGNYVRLRSVDNFLEEIAMVKNKYGLKRIYFSDDTFILNRVWLEEFCKEYKKEINVEFIAQIRADLIDKDIVKLLKQAGCRGVTMGIETGNEYLRNEILKKKVTDNDIIKAARIIKNNGLKLKTFNMICLPGESIEDGFKTVEINNKIKSDLVAIGFAQPFPGTVLLDYAKEQGYLDKNYDPSRMNLNSRNYPPLILKDKKELENLLFFVPLLSKFYFLKPIIKLLIRCKRNIIFEMLHSLLYAWQTFWFYRPSVKDVFSYWLFSNQVSLRKRKN